MAILRVNERLQAPAQAEVSLTLSFEQRQKSRLRVRLDNGEEVGLSLAHGTVLRGGDRLRAEDGRIIEVRSAPEPVTTAFSEDPSRLARAAYHLGNRHIALQIGEGWVRYLADPVLDAMVEGWGLPIVRETRPFEPEIGAYPSRGHDHQAAHAESHG